MKKNKFKKIIFGIGIIILTIVLAVLFGGKNKESNKPLTSSTNMISTSTPQKETEAELVNKEFISILVGINNIFLDSTIFSRATFKDLHDFTKDIVQLENEGRSNPFAPIGVEETSVVSNVISETNNANVDVINNDLPDTNNMNEANIN